LIGRTIGSYQVVAKLGEGGMGVVYRARDTKLNRDVAIKVLPPEFAADAERLARFTREAHTLAALNHQNIAQIYGLETTSEVGFLVMELVEGEDLSTQIARGPIAPADALNIARQLADALETAHEQGIVHRDLKPANIKVRPDSTVKVLDFGLAKVWSRDGASGELANSPTLTNRATEAGIILGTAAYMSPEQAKGRTVDKRADIWAFGVVLHEMLTGRRAFEGESIAETLGLIFSREIDLSTLPDATPAALRQLISRCLVRDPKRRLRDMGEARLQIEDAAAPSAAAGSKDPASVAPASAAPRPRPVWQLASVAALLAAAAGIAGWIAKPVPASSSVRLSIALLPGEQVTSIPAISADGQLIAYAAGRTPASSQLYLRALNDDAPRAVFGSAGAQYPFFSPDGRTIAFFAAGKLRRTSVAGGAATDIASVPTPWGGTWDADGQIVFVSGLGSGLWRVSPDGGKPEQLTKPDGAGAGYAHVFPQRLPGTRDLLFDFWGQSFHSAVWSAATRTWREVTPPARTLPGVAVYVPGGFLITSDRTGSIQAARWAPSVVTPVSPQTPVLQSVFYIPGPERAFFAASDSGTAVYVPGRPTERHLVWVDRRGEASVVPGDPDLIQQAALSHDGKRVVYGSLAGQWIVDLTTGARTRLVSDFRSWHGVWLPGDGRIAISSNKDGDWDLYTIAPTRGEATLLLKKPYAQHVQAATRDGLIVYLERQPATGSDLWTLAPDGTTNPLVVTPFNDTSASVSPDGKYVAYVSDGSGRDDVFALPISGKGERIAVSINGGTGPLWSRDGRELFYRAGDDLISVSVSTSGPLVLGERRRLLDLSPYDSGAFHEFDVSPDGKRFLLIRTEPAARPYRLNIITNWIEELRRKVQ
jgi:serine/threonine-protein kinase